MRKSDSHRNQYCFHKPYVLCFKDELAEFLGGILSQSVNSSMDGGDELDIKRKRKRKVSRDLGPELGSPPTMMPMGRVSTIKQ